MNPNQKRFEARREKKWQFRRRLLLMLADRLEADTDGALWGEIQEHVKQGLSQESEAIRDAHQRWVRFAGETPEEVIQAIRENFGPENPEGPKRQQLQDATEAHPATGFSAKEILTQQELANRSGVPLATVQHFKQTGEIKPADALKINRQLNALDFLMDVVRGKELVDTRTEKPPKPDPLRTQHGAANPHHAKIRDPQKVRRNQKHQEEKQPTHMNTPIEAEVNTTLPGSATGQARRISRLLATGFPKATRYKGTRNGISNGCETAGFDVSVVGCGSLVSVCWDSPKFGAGERTERNDALKTFLENNGIFRDPQLKNFYRCERH